MAVARWGNRAGLLKLGLLCIRYRQCTYMADPGFEENRVLSVLEELNGPSRGWVWMPTPAFRAPLLIPFSVVS